MIKLYEQCESLNNIQNSNEGNKEYPKMMRKEEIHTEYNELQNTQDQIYVLYACEQPQKQSEKERKIFKKR